MSVAEIQDLQQTIQNMQELHRQEIESLKQQLRSPEQAFQLTPDQIISKFQKIKSFYGKGDYSLQEFLHAVENVGALCGNNSSLLQYGLQVVFKEKIQGAARIAVQRLGSDVSWDQVKAELKLHFKPRKTYKKLMDQTRSIKVSNLRELFSVVKTINYELNELFEYDDNKPPNYSPENNDRNLVDIVKDMINGCYRINITNNMKLIEVINLFDNLGILDESDVIHPNFRKYSKDNKNSFVSRKDFKRDDNDRRQDKPSNPNQNHNFKQDSGQFRQNYNFRQNSNHNSNNYRRNDNQNRSGQFRQNDPHNNNRNFNYNNTFNNKNSGNFRNEVVPMEVDNIQGQDVNFLDKPRMEDSQSSPS